MDSELPYEEEAWTELTVKDVKRQFDLRKACFRSDGKGGTTALVPETDWHDMLKKIHGEVSALELGGFLENEERISGFRPGASLALQPKTAEEKTPEDKFEETLRTMASLGVPSSHLEALKEGRKKLQKEQAETSESDIQLPLRSDSSIRETIAYGESGATEKQQLLKMERAWRKRVKLAKTLDRELTSQLRALCSRNMLTEIDSGDHTPTTASKMIGRMGELVMRSRTMTVEQKKKALKDLRLESFNWNMDNYQTQVLKIRDEIKGIEGSGVTEHKMCQLVMLSLRQDHRRTYDSLLDGYLGAVDDPEEGLSLMGKGGLLKRLKAKYNEEIETGRFPDAEQKVFGLQMKCKHCSASGHLESQCWEKHPEKKPDSRNHSNRGGGGQQVKPCPKCGNRHHSKCWFKGKCHNCGGNHAARVCSKKKNHVAKLCFGPPDDSGSDDDAYDSLIVKKTLWKEGHENIAFDTAANSHVTPYKTGLKDYRPLTGSTVQGVGAKGTTVTGTGRLKFGLRDQQSSQIVELEFPKTLHLPETSQPLIAAHRVHMMCHKKGWYSKSEQDYKGGVLNIDTGESRFSFALVPIDGIYCFKSTDVYLLDMPLKSGDKDDKDKFAATAKVVTTRGQKQAGGAKTSHAEGRKMPAATGGPSEEQKTSAGSSQQPGEHPATAGGSEPANGSWGGNGHGGDVDVRKPTKGEIYAPARPGDGAGFSDVTHNKGVTTTVSKTGNNMKTEPESIFISPTDLKVVQGLHAATAHTCSLRSMQEQVSVGVLNVSPKEARAIKKAHQLNCEHCLKAQGRNTPTSKKSSKTVREPGEVMFLDGNEGLPRSMQGNTIEYLVGDAATGQVEPYHRNSKDEDTILEIIQHRLRYIERVTGRKMKRIVVRCDWWSGQWSKKVTKWLASQGIAHEMRQAPAPGAENHKGNGAAEVAVRVSNNGWRANKSSSGLSDQYREYISNQHWLVKNNTAKKRLGWRTPQQELTNTLTKPMKFYSIGARCLARVGTKTGKGNYGKFEALILGNCRGMQVEGMKGGFFVLNLETGKIMPRMIQPSDVFTDEFPMLDPKPRAGTRTQGGGGSSPRQEEEEQKTTPMTLRQRGGLPPLKFDQMDYDEKMLKAMVAKFEERDSFYTDMAIKALRAEVLPLPKNLSKSLKTEHKEVVLDSWMSELVDHLKRGSIVKRLLEDIPEGAKFLPCDVLTKWKTDLDGFITRAKSRLIAKGYRQEAGVHFRADEVSAPVANEDTHRLVLLMALLHAEQVNLVDIRVAYLNAKLEPDEIMYIKPRPEWGFASDECLELRRCIPGLKQSGHKWNKLLTATLKESGFKPSKVDPCLFVKQDGDGAIKGVATCHVDDLLMTGAKTVIDQLRKDLGDKFEIHDIGPAEEHLGVKIEYDHEKGELKLSQEQYAKELLEEWGMEDCNPAHTPASEIRLTEEMCPKTDKERAKMAGVREKLHSGIMKLRWLAQKTRYELCFAVGELCRYTANPGEKHLYAFKRVLRYLKGTLDMKLVYKRPKKKKNDVNESIEDECMGYSDASWADNPNGESTGGYVFMMCGGAICAKSARQKLVATSTAESELIQLNNTAKQGVWLRLLREQLGMDNSKPMVLMEDNAAAQRIAETGRRSKRSKHFRVREFWIHEKVKDKTFVIRHCPTTEMVADLMTKPLPRATFEKLRTMMGIVQDPV